MTSDAPNARYRHMARVVLEARSPLSIGAGRDHGMEDAPVVTDANGRPSLPGSSIAGVLRAMYSSGREADAVDGLFGHRVAQGDGGGRSRLTVSWGCIHDATGTPVCGLVDPERMQDPILTDAVRPVIRDHVRLSHRGTADQRGKFDRSAVRPGHRFSFDLVIEGGEEARGELDALLALLSTGRFALGAATRSGYGELALVWFQARSFDLARAEDRRAWLDLVGDLAQPAALGPRQQATPGEPPEAAVELRLQLMALEPWIVGGGEGDTSTDPSIDGDGKPRSKEADMNPLTVHRVRWDSSGRGALDTEPDYLLPASTIKGALRHRAAFHYRCLLGSWAQAEAAGRADRVTDTGADPWAPDQLPGLARLFGSAGDSDTEPAAGHVWVSDGQVASTAVKRHRSVHVSIDRFTGGARRGLLFQEDVLYGDAPIDVTIGVTVPSDADEQLTLAHRALARAIEDLCCGRLQLGGGGGRGRGWFEAAQAPDLSALLRGGVR